MKAILPHFALQLALSGGSVGVPVDATIGVNAAVTVAHSDFNPEASNSAVSANPKPINVARVLPSSEAEWVVDWLIRMAKEAPEVEVEKLPPDLSSTVDRNLYGI